MNRIAVALAALLSSGCSCSDRGPVGARATLEVNPAELRFEGVPFGTTRTMQLKLVNSGRSELVVAGVRVTDDDAGVFSVGAFPPPIAVGSSADLDVTFNSRSRGRSIALLRIGHEGANGPETTVALFGSSPAGTCTSIACPAGEVCYDGRCLPLDCGALTCRQDELCIDGRCSSPSDLCKGVVCAAPPACHAAAGATCDKASGKCSYPAVADGTLCTGGVCKARTCTDLCATVTCNAPPVCATATGATCDKATGKCSYPGAPDGSACGAGGANLCDAGSCVECRTAADCDAKIDNSAGCYLVSCSPQKTCSNLQRRDGVNGFLSSPVLSAELKLVDSALPLQAVFDGVDFAVLVTDPTNAVKSLRRISRRAALVDPAPIVVDSAALDLAVSTGRYLVVTTEPADAAHSNQWIGGYNMSRAGQALGGKFDVIVDTGGNCAAGVSPNMFSPRVAGSRQADSFLVYALSGCGSLWRGRIVSPTAGAQMSIGLFPGQRPRVAVPVERDNGFIVSGQDNSSGGGLSDVRAEQYDVAGNVTANYQVIQPVDPVTDQNAPTAQNSNLVWGTSSYLMFYVRRGNQAEIVTPGPGTLNHSGVPVTLASGLGYGPTTATPAELGFDGANFLALDSSAGPVPAQRLSAAGTLLDATPFNLTGPGVAGAQYTQLASDRAGRYLVAYQKGDGHTYARLFSTCP